MTLDHELIVINENETGVLIKIATNLEKTKKAVRSIAHVSGASIEASDQDCLNLAVTITKKLWAEKLQEYDTQMIAEATRLASEEAKNSSLSAYFRGK